MKLLRVKATNFKNCEDNFTIDLVARARKTQEDKEYELQETASGLYVFNTLAFAGKNASGKTSAVELLDACYSILGEFRLSGKYYSVENTELEIIFYHEGYIYKYAAKLNDSPLAGRSAMFSEQKIYKKKYYKSEQKHIYSDEGFAEAEVPGELPKDTSILFFVLKDAKTRAIYYDSFGCGPDTYDLVFTAVKSMNIPQAVFNKILTLFDPTISEICRLDSHNYKITVSGKTIAASDQELIYRISSGTTKGMLLYLLAAASLQNGFDLVIDEIENHFHKTLVENLLVLYKDKHVNKNGATLIFTTHYNELLDLFNRQDNIYITRADKKVFLKNVYDDYNIRSELKKGRLFYNNAFGTAVDYEALMSLKWELRK